MFWIKCFLHKDGIHVTLSPRTIVTGSNIDHNKHCRLQFGSYVQVHEQHYNSMATRTSGAIALRPTGNAQGSYYFLSLHTGKCIVRNNWTVLPMPNEVIATIHQLAKACKNIKDSFHRQTRQCDQRHPDVRGRRRRRKRHVG